MAANCSHYACHLSSSCHNFLQSATLLTKANAGGWTGPRHTRLSPEPTRAADVPPWRSSCRPGIPGLRRAQRPAPERCVRARGGPASRPMAGSPARAKGVSLQTVAFSRQPGERCGGEPRYAKSTSKKTSRAMPRTLGADGAPETDRRAGRSSVGWSSRLERGLAGNQGLSGSQLGPRRASRPRRGQSGQHPSSKTRLPGTSGSGTARGPRPTNGRNGSGEKDLR